MITCAICSAMIWYGIFHQLSGIVFMVGTSYLDAYGCNDFYRRCKFVRVVIFASFTFSGLGDV